MIKIGNIYKRRADACVDFPELIEITSGNSDFTYEFKIIKQGKTILDLQLGNIPKRRIIQTYEYDKINTLKNKLNILINV